MQNLNCKCLAINTDFYLHLSAIKMGAILIKPYWKNNYKWWIYEHQYINKSTLHTSLEVSNKKNVRFSSDFSGGR